MEKADLVFHTRSSSRYLSFVTEECYSLINHRSHIRNAFLRNSSREVNSKEEVPLEIKRELEEETNILLQVNIGEDDVPTPSSR